MKTGICPGCKVWLEKGGTALGEGFFTLLSLIGEKGSISAAAVEMGMSYRTAWGKVKKAESAWGVKLIDARTGGKSGGGSGLTPEAGMIMDRFRELRNYVESLVQAFEVDKK